VVDPPSIFGRLPMRRPETETDAFDANPAARPPFAAALSDAAPILHVTND
jgi:hypothetical protein